MTKLLLIGLLSLAACDDKPVTRADNNYRLGKAEDAENGITCYRIIGYEGVHCFTENEMFQSRLTVELYKKQGDK